MNRKIVNRILLVLFLMALFALGYLRDFIFITINAQSSAAFYHDTRPVLQGLMQFTFNKGYSSLIRLKWVFTLIFYFAYLLTALCIVYLVFKERIYIHICLVLYGVLAATAFIVIMTGCLFHSFSIHTYNIARNIMHISQSPFTVALLLALGYYHKKNVKS